MVKTIEITTRIGCPMICKFCPQDLLITRYKQKSDKYNMSFDDYKKAIDKVPKDIRIDFSGMAEPWLNKECTNMLLYAWQTGHKIAVYTTAVGMSIKDVKRIRNIPFEIFMLHLPDAHNNAKIPITEEYIKVLTKIKDMDICNFQRMSMGYINHKVSHIFKWEINSIMHSRAGNLTSIQSSNTNVPTTCNGDSNPERGVLLPNGDVLLCCNDYGMRHVLGNLLEQSYDDLFKSDEFKKIVKGLQNGGKGNLCEKCIYANRGKII